MLFLVCTLKVLNSTQPGTSKNVVILPRVFDVLIMIYARLKLKAQYLPSHGIVVQCLFEIDVLPRRHTVVIVYTCNTYQCCAGDKFQSQPKIRLPTADCFSTRQVHLVYYRPGSSKGGECENEAVKGWQHPHAGGLSWQAHMLIVLLTLPF